MKIFFPLVAAAVLAASLAHASEEAKDLLKVPPADERPLADGAAPTKPEKDTGSKPEETPTPAPAEAEPAPAAAAENISSDSEIVPEPYPVSRYALLWENSPFQNESVAPPVESPGLSQRFALGSILRQNGEYVVWVQERATQQSHKVEKTAPNKLGLTLVEVAEDPANRNESSATVRLGAEIGVIKRDAAGAVPGVPAMPSPFVPQPVNAGVRPFPQAQRPGVPTPIQPPQPSVPVPQPQAGGMVNPGVAAPGIVPPVPGPGIPSEGQAQVAPGQGQPMPPPRVIRRRAIVPATP